MKLIRQCLLIGCLLYAYAISVNAYAQPQKVIQTQSESTAKLNLSLSEDVQEAINHGVSLTFVCEFAKHQTWFFLNWQDIQKEHRFVLTHHALSNRYMVQRISQQKPSLFRSLGGAMDFITAQSLSLLDRYSDSQHSYSLRVSLSKYELPGPMRLNAFISSDWNLDTGWISWQSNH